MNLLLIFNAVLLLFLTAGRSETQDEEKNVIYFHPISQEQYDTLLGLTNGETVISEGRLIASGLAALKSVTAGLKLGLATGWLPSIFGLQNDQPSRSSNYPTNYPLCVVKSDNPEQIEKRSNRQSSVIQCVVVLSGSTNKPPKKQGTRIEVESNNEHNTATEEANTQVQSAIPGTLEEDVINPEVYSEDNDETSNNDSNFFEESSSVSNLKWDPSFATDMTSNTVADPESNDETNPLILSGSRRPGQPPPYSGSEPWWLWWPYLPTPPEPPTPPNPPNPPNHPPNPSRPTRPTRPTRPPSPPKPPKPPTPPYRPGPYPYPYPHPHPYPRPRPRPRPTPSSLDLYKQHLIRWLHHNFNSNDDHSHRHDYDREHDHDHEHDYDHKNDHRHRYDHEHDYRGDHDYHDREYEKYRPKYYSDYRYYDSSAEDTRSSENVYPSYNRHTIHTQSDDSRYSGERFDAEESPESQPRHIEARHANHIYANYRHKHPKHRALARKRSKAKRDVQETAKRKQRANEKLTTNENNGYVNTIKYPLNGYEPAKYPKYNYQANYPRVSHMQSTIDPAPIYSGSVLNDSDKK